MRRKTWKNEACEKKIWKSEALKKTWKSEACEGKHGKMRHAKENLEK